MLIAQSTFTHICQLNCALRAGVHKPVAADGVKLCCGNDLCEFLHVGRLDIDNVKALILNVQVPQVDPQIVTADESLSIAVYRYAVDVVCVCVGVCLPRYGSDDGIVVSEAR